MCSLRLQLENKLSNLQNMKDSLPAFHSTLSSAINAVNAHLLTRKIVIAENEKNWTDVFCFGGLAYGENKEAHFPIASLKEKPTRKFGHVTIWRNESGRYEVNFYIL